MRWPARRTRAGRQVVRAAGLGVPRRGLSRGSSIQGMGTLAPVPGIRGRATETQVLGEALDRVAAGHPAVILIEGVLTITKFPSRGPAAIR